MPPTRPSAEAPVNELLQEAREVRRLVETTLRLLQDGSGSLLSSSAAPVPGGRGPKAVLLVDDDPTTREAARVALCAAPLAVRAVGDGSAALAAIAADKPDAIVLELALGGAMSGKDVVNMVKATMEWVDIPIVLYTRAPVTDEAEARTLHGGDQLVAKAAGPAVLASRLTALIGT